MAGKKPMLTSPQRVLVSMDESMKKEAAEIFAARGVSFSEGVRQCIAAQLGGQEERIPVDGETRKEAEEALADMGLDVGTAVNMFLREVARTGCIPFAVQTGKGSCVYALVPLEQEAKPATQD